MSSIPICFPFILPRPLRPPQKKIQHHTTTTITTKPRSCWYWWWPSKNCAGEHGSPSLVSIASGCGVTIGILESSLTFVASKLSLCTQDGPVNTPKLWKLWKLPNVQAVKASKLRNFRSVRSFRSVHSFRSFHSFRSVRSFRSLQAAVKLTTKKEQH